jgi:CheY-like chemotaxis protein
VVLLDIGLPILNGYEVCRRIRQQEWGKKTTIIAISGWGQPQDKLRATESGFDVHVTKPIEWTTLVKLLDTRMGSEALTQPLAQPE